MEEALRAFLLAQASLVALVDQRCDWGLRPRRDALSAVTLTVISAPRTYTFAGVDDLRFYRLQVDCWGLSYGAAKRVARAIETAFDALTGQVGFGRAFFLNETDGTEPDASGQPVSRTRLELRLPYTAS